MFSGFEWDARKNAANLAKHGIDFDDAIGVFEGPVVERDLAPRSDESRFLVVGMVEDRVIAVIYPPRGDRRRIVSARRASRRERATYRDAFPPGPEGQDPLGPG